MPIVQHFSDAAKNYALDLLADPTRLPSDVVTAEEFAEAAGKSEGWARYTLAHLEQLGLVQRTLRSNTRKVCYKLVNGNRNGFMTFFDKYLNKEVSPLDYIRNWVKFQGDVMRNNYTARRMAGVVVPVLLRRIMDAWKLTAGRAPSSQEDIEKMRMELRSVADSYRGMATNIEIIANDPVLWNDSLLPQILNDTTILTVFTEEYCDTLLKEAQNWPYLTRLD